MTSRAVRIGMITPSSNTCLEPVTYRLLAGREDVTVHFARVAVTRVALDVASAEQYAVDRMRPAAQLLADAKVDVIVWNGTSGSWIGIDHDRALTGELSRIAGVPATTSTLAILAALQTYGVTRVGLASPSPSEMNQRVRTVYAAEGIEIGEDSALGITDNDACARVPVGTIGDQARSVSGRGAEAVVVLCTNVYGAQLAESFEVEHGIPLLDSVAVTLWHALVLAKVTKPILGRGTLLRDGLARHELQTVTSALLQQTSADRVTLRLDLPRPALTVDLACAESIRPAARSIRRDRSLDQRSLDTVRWLETHRRNLIQPNFRNAPSPPAALVEAYGVEAQMLGPVERSGELTGWISVHSATERYWSSTDVEALNRARQQVQDVLGLLEQDSATAAPTWIPGHPSA